MPSTGKTSVWSRQAFVIEDFTFKEADGDTYTPTTVEKRVVTDGGTVLTDWETLSGFTSGDDIAVDSDEVEIQDSDDVSDNHFVSIVGDRDTSSENPIVIDVLVRNREKRV
jgi:hypothetical protein